MRRRILVLSCLLSIAFVVAALPACAPQAEFAASVAEESTSVWVQSTVSDFKGGVLERIEIQREGDGELTLAKTGDGVYEKTGVYTSPQFRVDRLFSAAIWQWDVSVPDGTSLVFAVRTSLDGEQWTDWQETEPDDDLRSLDTDWPGHLWIVDEAQFLQFRLQFATTRPDAAPRVDSVQWTFTDARPGPTLQEAMQMVLPEGEGPGVPRPAIIPRRGWGANESLMTWDPEYATPTKIIIHHTATSNGPQDYAATVRAVYYYHAVTRGWGDIGYNYLIDPLGNIYEGRAGGERAIGGHDYGFNTGSVGISLIGNYQDAAPSAAIMDALVRLVAWVCDHYGIDPMGRSDFHTVPNLANISAHRETKQTTCPGDQMMARFGTLRAQVRDTLEREVPFVRLDSPKEGDVLTGDARVQATGGSTTAEITFYIDNAPFEKAVGASLDLTWDTRAVSDGDHLLKVVARDDQGAEASEAALVLVDNTPPRCVLIINGGEEYATEKAITLTVDAFDVGSGLDSMQLTEGGDLSLAPAQPYQEQIPLLLDDQPGIKTFSVQVFDRAGLASNVSTTQVFFDPNPPAPWSGLIQSNVGELGVQIRDDASGLDLSTALFATSPDGGLTWEMWHAAEVTQDDAGTATLTAATTPDVTAVEFQIADRAGNVALSPVYFVPCADCNPPQTPPPPQPAPAMPDLTIGSVEVIPPAPAANEPAEFRAVIRNAGDADATGFWVELYLDPLAEPYVNSISSQMGTGIFWYVEGLAAGAELTLTSTVPYGLYGNYPGYLASGMHTVYVLADAYNTEGITGLVQESNESNNLYGPVSVEVPRTASSSLNGLQDWLSRLFNW